MSTGNPPWYETDEDGQITILEVPARLKSHPEVLRRGFELEPAYPCKIGVVYRTSLLKEPLYHIKILDTDTQEAAMFQLLSRQLTSPEAGHPLLITPSLFVRLESCSLMGRVISCFQGIEYMHSLHIAHMDICPGNVVAAARNIGQRYPDVEPGKAYLIDFGSSLQFTLGPGSQPAIVLPPSQFRLEYDITYFDPYSWDVYCAALTMQRTMETYYGRHPPLIARLYASWLEGKERGCTTVCHCRPTARRARQVLTGIVWGVRAWEFLKNVLYNLKALRLPLLS
ncbi:hypothetical protein C8Q73DRAFT_748913 [Cubamyces lactineus]|nr:hypothetical protein C8Q73DRAFT_748913 [Cubamyces lactineus]